MGHLMIDEFVNLGSAIIPAVEAGRRDDDETFLNHLADKLILKPIRWHSGLRG